MNKKTKLLYMANTNDEKERAICSMKYHRKGCDFYPCQGLMYWIRCNEYIFDIREVRELFGKDREGKSDYLPLSYENFKLKIKEMCSYINGNDFITEITLK